MQSGPNQNCCCSNCFGLFGRRVDLVDHYEKKLEDLEENVRMEQSEVSLAGDVRLNLFPYYVNVFVLEFRIYQKAGQKSTESASSCFE